MSNDININFVDENGNVINTMKISPKETKKQEKTTFLDKSVILNFHEIIDSARNIFSNVDGLKDKYNLICAFTDRIISSVDYLNCHSKRPKTEEDFICFLVFASILRDGIKTLYQNFYQTKPPYVEEKKYFRYVKKYDGLYFTEETCPTDEEFFEYLRSMAFAHPHETSKDKRNRPFMQSGEKQLCPWVIVKHMSFSAGLKDAVGIRIYSNKFPESMLDIFFSFNDLKGYIRDRYECIKELTEWVKRGVNHQNTEWQQTKINREQSGELILKEIKDILEERFQDTYIIDDVLEYLTCNLTLDENIENVDKYRKAILNLIPKVCDCVETLDYEGMENVFETIFEYPKEMHQSSHYQLEKIFCYLNDEERRFDVFSNESWGLKQAEAFSKYFAQKWVKINVNSMTLSEIKLLVRTACFLEKESQKISIE